MSDERSEKTAYCACLNVKYDPEDVLATEDFPGEDGCPPIRAGMALKRDRWSCLTCGAHFIRKGVSDHLIEAARAEGDLSAWIDRTRTWSEDTFGTHGRPIGIVKHIRSELDEILRDPTDLTEWVDVILLAIDGARRQGYSGREIVDELKLKQAVNEAREWVLSLDPEMPTFHEPKEADHD